MSHRTSAPLRQKTSLRSILAWLKPILVFIAVICMASPSFAAPQSDAETPTDAAVQPADSSDGDASTQEANDNEPNNDAAPAKSEASDASDENGDSGKSWTQVVDEAFGEYLVKPVMAVLFFDCTFGKLKDAKGNGPAIPFVVAWLFAGTVFLTLRMGFINFRGFFHAIQLTRGVYDTPGEPGEVSHFQALAAALSATVGLGNIAGVAIAIAKGGPGATFWIIIVGFMGMSAKFAECTLGQLYRVTDEDGTVIGGPMRYLKYGLQELKLGILGTVLSVLFMILCIGASMGGGNAFQVGQSLEAIRGDVPILETAPWAYGVVMAVAVGVVIIGGIKSIGAVAGKIVPVMCLAYVSVALFILVTHAGQIPDAVGLIITQAFTPDAAWGGFIGVMVIGIQRAVFSNEAGVGSAAIAHSAAKTDEPVSEGIVALLEPFIDTVVVCTITALMVVITGAYLAPENDVKQVEFSDGNTISAPAELDKIAALMEDNVQTNLVITPQDSSDSAKERVEAIKSYLQESKNVKVNRLEIAKPPEKPDENVTANSIAIELAVAKSKGARITLQAFVSGGHDWFRYILFLAVVLFAYSTCISWFYYGERCWVELFGQRTSVIFKGLFLLFTVLGSIVTQGKVLDFSDLMILGMSIPNLFGVFIMSGLVKRQLDIYWKKHKNGELERADQYK